MTRHNGYPAVHGDTGRNRVLATCQPSGLSLQPPHGRQHHRTTTPTHLRNDRLKQPHQPRFSQARTPRNTKRPTNPATDYNRTIRSPQTGRYPALTAEPALSITTGKRRVRPLRNRQHRTERLSQLENPGSAHSRTSRTVAILALGKATTERATNCGGRQPVTPSTALVRSRTVSMCG